MKNRLNGYYGDINWDDFFGEDGHKDINNGVSKEQQNAIEFAASLRGQWLLGMALYVSLDVLSEQTDNVMEDDLKDMQRLMDQLFPMYKHVIEGGGLDDD